MRTFSTSLLAVAFALGFASCSNDNNEPDDKKTGASVTVDSITHPWYSNGAMNVIAGSSATIDASHVQVSITPPQEYTLEFVPEENESFTFTSGGVLTGLVEGDDVGEINIRVLASDGKVLTSKKITVNVVGILVSINHTSYVNDTFRVVAGSSIMLKASNVTIVPANEAYSIKFAQKTTRYFTLSGMGSLSGVLNGTGAIEVLVMNGSDTVKVQPFNVKVSPNPSWVTAVKVVKDDERTIYFESSKTETPTPFAEYFKVEGGVNRTLRYTSSNPTVATVDESTGMVTVHNVPYYAFIKATAIDGSEIADSVRVTTARKFSGQSCDWNLCNILSSSTKEDSRYVSCKVWDGNVATSWVYRMQKTFTRNRYPGITFLRGVYGKDPDPTKEEYNLMAPDFVTGGVPIPKKENTWGVWAANMDALQTLKKIIVTRGFYTDEKGRKIYQSGTMYLELWDNNSATSTLVKLGKQPFTSKSNENEWVIDLTKSFEKWDVGTDASLGTVSYPDGVTGTELQMMFSTEKAELADDGNYYWAIADVLLFE
jgi:hypothetical protein